MNVQINQFKKFIGVFIDRFSRHDLLTLSAALAFYTALSLAPLMLITLSVLGLLGSDTQDRLVQQIQGLVGANAAEAVNVVIEGAKERPDLSRLGGILGFLALFFSASGVFAQLQSSLNLIWDTDGNIAGGYKIWIKRRLLSMGMVLSLGFVSIVSLVVTAGLSFVFADSSWLWTIVNQLISLGVFAGLFAAIYKVLPDLPLRWRESFIGGMITAVLFVIGKQLIGIYLGQSAVASAYGAMGSFMVLLIWVYYSALILFIGAELTAQLNEKTLSAAEAARVQAYRARHPAKTN